MAVRGKNATVLWRLLVVFFINQNYVCGEDQSQQLPIQTQQQPPVLQTLSQPPLLSPPSQQPLQQQPLSPSSSQQPLQQEQLPSSSQQQQPLSPPPSQQPLQQEQLPPPSSQPLSPPLSQQQQQPLSSPLSQQPLSSSPSQQPLPPPSSQPLPPPLSQQPLLPPLPSPSSQPLQQLQQQPLPPPLSQQPLEQQQLPPSSQPLQQLQQQPLPPPLSQQPLEQQQLPLSSQQLLQPQPLLSPPSQQPSQQPLQQQLPPPLQQQPLQPLYQPLASSSSSPSPSKQQQQQQQPQQQPQLQLPSHKQQEQQQLQQQQQQQQQQKYPQQYPQQYSQQYSQQYPQQQQQYLQKQQLPSYKPIPLKPISNLQSNINRIMPNPSSNAMSQQLSQFQEMPYVQINPSPMHNNQHIMQNDGLPNNPNIHNDVQVPMQSGGTHDQTYGQQSSSQYIPNIYSPQTGVQTPLQYSQNMDITPQQNQSNLLSTQQYPMTQYQSPHNYQVLGQSMDSPNLSGSQSLPNSMKPQNIMGYVTEGGMQLFNPVPMISPFVRQSLGMANRMNDYITGMKRNVGGMAYELGNRIIDGEKALASGITKSVSFFPNILYQFQQKGLNGFAKLMELSPPSPSKNDPGEMSPQYYEQTAGNQHYNNPSMSTPYYGNQMQSDVQMQQRPQPSNVGLNQNQVPVYQQQQSAIKNPVGSNPISAPQPIRNY